MTPKLNLIDQLTNEKTQQLAFKKLVSEYKERLYWHIRRIVLNHDDAHDVLQNTFIKVFRNIHSFKGDSSLYSWIYRIATNESLTFLNQKKKRSGLSSEQIQEKLIQNLKSDAYFDGEQAMFILQEAISKLPEKQRLVFNMKYFDNMKYNEISEILDTSIGALKASYHHATKKIEKFIKTH